MMPLATDPAQTQAALAAMNPGIAVPSADPAHAAPAPAYVPPATVTAAPVMPATEDGMLRLPKSVLDDLYAAKSKLAQMEAEQSTLTAAARQKEALLLSQKGEHETALKMAREQAESQLRAAQDAHNLTLERAKQSTLERELAVGLSGKDFVEGGAQQVAALLKGDFIAEAQGNTFTVRTADYKSVGDHIAAMLGRPDFAHFLKAKNPGGGVGTNPGTTLSAPTPAAPAPSNHPTEAVNLGQAILFQHRFGDKPQGHDIPATLTGGSAMNTQGERVSLPSQAFGGFAQPNVFGR